MLYPIQCECGAICRVDATQAGSIIHCKCGRQVAIPSLSKLKAMHGESAMSADLRIEQMLERGMLPAETNCLICQSATKDVTYCWMVCERANVQQSTDWEPSWWAVFTVWLGFISFKKMIGETVDGRDRRFRLPLRVCANCRNQLRDTILLKETLQEVPIYDEMLTRFPDADVSLDLGLSDMTRREPH